MTSACAAHQRADETEPVMADPIHQFEIHKIFTIAKIGGHEIAFTNSSLFMVIAVGLDRRAAGRHDQLAQPRAGAAAVARGTLLRICRDDDHEVPPAPRG